VAGAAEMNYKKFLMFNVCGGIGWVFFIMGLGYFLGSIEWVKHNLEKAVLLVIVLSLMPIGIEFIKSHLRGRAAEKSNS
jgi:membrane-associated protein